MNQSRIFIHACGGIGPDGRIWQADATRSSHDRDAAPIALKPLIKASGIAIPRVASRFAELATLGAHTALQRLRQPLPTTTRLYLATGLGDVARTDALYYQVMPPSGEVASPAHFATSGNNMASFFVAQYAGLCSRNLTVCADALSLERALQNARSDLEHGTARSAFVGSVDETTVPREFYVRRFALRDDQCIGEASGWFALNTVADGAEGALLDVQIWSTPPGPLDDAAMSCIAQRLGRVIPSQPAPATLLTGCRFDPDDARRLAALAQLSVAPEYLSRTGVFPTAACLAMIEAMQSESHGTFVHVNRDEAGRTGIIVLRSHGN